MPDHSFLGSAIVLGGAGAGVVCLHSHCIVDIILGGWQDLYTERLVDSVMGRARDAMMHHFSCVARGDSRAYRWRPREVMRAHQYICCVLEKSGRIEHEPINGVDVNFLM